MTGFGPPNPQDPYDDPSNRPTRMANYSAGVDPQPPGFDDQPDYSEPAEPESPPAPWYRKRSLLAVWATMVAILVVLIIYGLIQLSRGGGGGGGETSTTTPSTTPESSTTTPSTTPPSTTTPPSSSTPEPGPPNGNAPPPAQPPPPAAPPEHHHFPHIPPTITLPHTVITLPHGF